MTSYFFSNWLRFTVKHPHSHPEEKFLSFVMFIITTILWPLIVPLSLVEILKTRKLDLGTVVPVIFATVALSISFCLI
ncbi:MAG: hypothetical protein AAF378_00855 [Cyanobacteria bacterium P01_A01_bin.84]